MRPTTNEADGTARTRIRFAWLPVRLDGGRWLWWADYVATEQLEPDYGWSAGRWVVVSRSRVDA